jgi:predicted  nucleic acid-binding Zn-ribbon protein
MEMTKVLTREESSNNEQTIMVSTRGEGFNKKKNELKAFSEKLPKEAELPSVPVSGGLFGLFNYDVTGSDLNRLTESIQDKMIEQNKVLVRTIQEFNTIYDTFSALDKEYIQGILISLKAAEEANEKALKGIEGVETNQDEIKQIISQQKQVIQVLQKFKEKIDRIEHLSDVDTIFAIYSTMQDNVTAIESKIEAQDQTVADLTDETKSLLSSNKADIETLNKEVANQIEKLGDLKQLFQEDIQTLSEKVVRNHSEFEAKLVSTTNEVSKNKTDLENAMKVLNIGIEQQAESMSSYFESELSKAKNEIKELNLLTVSLSKELKTTRVFSFASIAVTCILVLLIMSGVL